MATKLPALIGGRYRPLGLLGQGGMGAVYEAEHTRTGERVALKVLHANLGANDKLVKRFMREARASSAIKSEHVVRVTDADIAPELDGAPFLVMELLEGADLERLTGEAPQHPAKVVEWLRQISRGLDRAHAAGIVHRDLKPENLFLTHREDGSPIVKILDFGIAKVAADAGVNTQSGQILGTPRFMAPEQARGESNVGPHTDLFSLGLIAFRLLTGQSYFEGETMAQLMAQLLVDPMLPPSTVGEPLTPEFDAWFARACDRDFTHRFATAGEQTEALAEALGMAAVPLAKRPSGEGRFTPMEVAKTIQATSFVGTTQRSSRLRRAALVALGMAVLGLGALVVRSGSTATSVPPAPSAPLAAPPSTASALELAPEITPATSGLPTPTATGTPGAMPSTTPVPLGALPQNPIAARPSGTDPPPGSKPAKTAPTATSVKPRAPDPLADQK